MTGSCGIRFPVKADIFRHSHRRDRHLSPFCLVDNIYQEHFQMDVLLMINDLIGFEECVEPYLHSWSALVQLDLLPSLSPAVLLK